MEGLVLEGFTAGASVGTIWWQCETLWWGRLRHGGCAAALHLRAHRLLKGAMARTPPRQSPRTVCCHTSSNGWDAWPCYGLLLHYAP